MVKVVYDPHTISFSDLLTVFFGSHDPTTRNRQGNDVGSLQELFRLYGSFSRSVEIADNLLQSSTYSLLTQYRSVIFYTTPEQKELAESFITEINESHQDGAPIVTEVVPLLKFYEAENYHKEYFAKNPEKPYCEIVINPKLEKVKQKFAELLKSGTEGG